jgi:hypothetical protein
MAQASVVLEFVNRIFLDYSPQYRLIRKIAERDVGQELLDKVKKFLEDKKKDDTTVKLPEKVILPDATVVKEEDIADIVDAFIKMRSENVFSEIDGKSINEILILFNQWIMIGKSPLQGLSPSEPRTQIISLEEQISTIEAPFRRESELYPAVQLQANVYGTGGPPQDVYSALSTAREMSSNPYFAISEYKMMRQSNL